MNTDELREHLVRMGRQPVPAPRPEFVEDLLARVQLQGELPTPEPLAEVHRPMFGRVRMVAVGAVAALVLGVVGLVSLMQKDTSVRTLSTLTAEPIVGQTPSQLKVESNGRVTDDNGAELPPGTYQASCHESGKFKVADGSYVECNPGDVIDLIVDNSYITHAEKVDSADSAGGEALQGTTSTTAPPASAGSGNTPSTAAPPPQAQTTVPAGQVTGNPQPAPAITGTTEKPTPVTIPGQTTPPPAPSTFDLKLQPGDKSVTLTWPAYTGTGFAKYVVLRTVSSTTEPPPTPTYDKANKSAAAVAAPIADPAHATFTETFDGSGVPSGTPQVSYRIAVLDANDNVLALSSTWSIQLNWTTLKTAELPPPSSTTTSTTSSTKPPTTSSTTATSSGH